jgi:uncharacterized protein (DUF433 family)
MRVWYGADFVPGLMERSDITLDYPCTADLVECFRYAHENAVSDVKNRHSQRCTTG